MNWTPLVLRYVQGVYYAEPFLYGPALGRHDNDDFAGEFCDFFKIKEKLLGSFFRDISRKSDYSLRTTIPGEIIAIDWFFHI